VNNHKLKQKVLHTTPSHTIELGLERRAATTKRGERRRPRVQVWGSEQTEHRNLLGTVAGLNIAVNQVTSASNILAQKSYVTTTYIVISLNHLQHKYMHTLFNIVRIY
jgi:hypothetical protein